MDIWNGNESTSAYEYQYHFQSSIYKTLDTITRLAAAERMNEKKEQLHRTMLPTIVYLYKAIGIFARNFSPTRCFKDPDRYDYNFII